MCMYSRVCVVFVCFCYVRFAHNGLLQFASIVYLVRLGFVSCYTTSVTEFFDIYHGH